MILTTSPTKTLAHHWPAGLKLGLLLIATTSIFFIDSVLILASLTASIIGFYALPSKSFFMEGIKGLRPLWPFLLIVGGWHILTETITEGMIILLRLITLVAMANLVTMTTRLSDMMAVILSLIALLRFVPILRYMATSNHVIALMFALVIRMIPVLTKKSQLLWMRWRSRSSRRPTWRILMPLMVLAIDDAEQVADALKARGGINHTEIR